MSRRRNLGPRGETGRLLLKHSVDHALMSPTEIRRLVDASRAGLRSAEFSSEVGRLLLTGAITSAEFAVAQRWATLAADYSRACCGPRPPRTPQVDANGGAEADPFSELGEREAKRNKRTIAEYTGGREILRSCSPQTERVVTSVVVGGFAAVGHADLKALHAGLGSLATWWSSRRPRG